MSSRLVVTALLLISCLVAIAEDKAKDKKAKAGQEQRPTIASVLDRQLSNLEKEFVPAADAMPDKFDFAPSNGEFKGVRTFAQQAKHVAATNLVIAAALLNEKPSFNPKLENGPEELKTKADAIKFLNESFAQAHKAIATISDKNATDWIPSPFNPESKSTRLSQASSMTWHSYDHYGQMVVYLRMNGVVPPASR